MSAPNTHGSSKPTLLAYLDALVGAEPDGAFIELRWRRAIGGMAQVFFPVRECGRAACTILDRGQDTDLFIGVAPRARREGTREAIERVHALWVDCDDVGAIEALGAYRPRPSIVVRSGTGRHAYWPHWPPVSPDVAEAGNRRLAQALGADMAATDAPRVLRPPGTLNFKSDPPRPVEVERLADDVYAVEQVVGHLPEPSESRPAATSGDPLLAIEPAVYVGMLTGREVGREGKVRCPFHAGGEERTASLHAYPTPEEGWTCFAGCGGGSIIDLGARLYGIEPRGPGYQKVRRRLAEALLEAEAA